MFSTDYSLTRRTWQSTYSSWTISPRIGWTLQCWLSIFGRPRFYLESLRCLTLFLEGKVCNTGSFWWWVSQTRRLGWARKLFWAWITLSMIVGWVSNICIHGLMVGHLGTFSNVVVSTRAFAIASEIRPQIEWVDFCADCCVLGRLISAHWCYLTHEHLDHFFHYFFLHFYPLQIYLECPCTLPSNLLPFQQVCHIRLLVLSKVALLEFLHLRVLSCYVAILPVPRLQSSPACCFKDSVVKMIL